MEHEKDNGHVMRRRSGILRGLLLSFLLALLAFPCVVRLAQTVTFGAATSFPVGSSPRSVAVGDFNGDGRLDPAVANFNGATVSILLGTGTGAFGAATNPVGSGRLSAAVGGCNGDGRLDLALADFTRSTVCRLL